MVLDDRERAISQMQVVSEAMEVLLEKSGVDAEFDRLLAEVMGREPWYTRMELARMKVLRGVAEALEEGGALSPKQAFTWGFQVGNDWCAEHGSAFTADGKDPEGPWRTIVDTGGV